MISTDNFIIAWRCWYDDGTFIPKEYTSINSTLDTLPEDGFQAMRLWYSNGGGRYMSGNDYYFFAEHPSGLIFGQSNDSYDSIVQRYPTAIIKRGKHTSDQMIHLIENTMINSQNPLINTPPPTPPI